MPHSTETRFRRGAEDAFFSATPVETAKAPNPVKSSPEFSGSRQEVVDDRLCHNKNREGKGKAAKAMKLTTVDFTDPAILKARTDGEIDCIIKRGHNDMPAEGQRITTE